MAKNVAISCRIALFWHILSFHLPFLPSFAVYINALVECACGMTCCRAARLRHLAKITGLRARFLLSQKNFAYRPNFCFSDQTQNFCFAKFLVGLSCEESSSKYQNCFFKIVFFFTNLVSCSFFCLHKFACGL